MSCRHTISSLGLARTTSRTSESERQARQDKCFKCCTYIFWDLSVLSLPLEFYLLFYYINPVMHHEAICVKKESSTSRILTWIAFFFSTKSIFQNHIKNFPIKDPSQACNKLIIDFHVTGFEVVIAHGLVVSQQVACGHNGSSL